MAASERAAGTAAELIPAGAGLEELREVAVSCTACELYKSGTQTVFGEGTEVAEVMLVGEQPGDREDFAGRPFVGPAGKLLDDALQEAGIDRSKVYVTNVVKHFKWEARGKRRIHKKPNMQEITACKPWLDAEVENVHPKVVVALGATAAKALIGKDFKVTERRGEFIPSDGDQAPVLTATVHPSSILRGPDDETRKLARKQFVEDLATIARYLEDRGVEVAP